MKIKMEPKAWYRSGFVVNFILGSEKPKNNTSNPNEWQPLYGIPKIKPLKWSEFSDNWYVTINSHIFNDYYYQVRIINGLVKIKRGNEDWKTFGGSIDEAKEFWYKDFSDKIKQVVEYV